jgi:hypothetical protein
MQLEMVSSGLRVGIKRPSDELREDVRPSKEPMLVLTSDSLNNSSHQFVGTGAASSGLGLALGLSGCAPVAASSVAPAISSTSNVVVGSSSGGGNGNGGGAGGGGVLHQLLGPVSSAAPPTHVASSAVGASSGGVGVVATAAGGGGAVGAAGGAFPPASSGTSSGSGGGGSNSKLYEKNKMLASLLAKTPIQSSLPTSIASPKPSALPQEKLPKDLKVGLRGLEPLFNIHAATVNAAESSQSSLLVIPIFYFFLSSLSLSLSFSFHSFIFFSPPPPFVPWVLRQSPSVARIGSQVTVNALPVCPLRGSFSIFFFKFLFGSPICLQVSSSEISPMEK